MAKAEKLEEGHYRTADGEYELYQYGEVWLVNERQGRRYVTVATVKTLAAGEKEITRLSKSEEPAEPVEVELPTEEA